VIFAARARRLSFAHARAALCRSKIRFGPVTWGFSVDQAACVFVDQAAQDGSSVDPRGAGVGQGEAGGGRIPAGDMLCGALVRPGGVVVLLVLREDGAQVRLAEDQRPAGDLAAQGAGRALADRVHAGCLDGADQDSGAGGLEHGAGRGGEVRAAVADQERELAEPLVKAEGEVAGLLHGPLAGGAGGDAAEVHPPGAVLDEHQDVQSLQRHGVCVQEIGGEDPSGLGVQELPPAGARAARCRAGASSVQDLPDGGRRHGDAKLEQLALDPAVAPQWILPRQAQHQPLDPRGSGRTAGPAPPARAVLLFGQPAVPGQERRRRDVTLLGF
jgi:hypothetical protein